MCAFNLTARDEFGEGHVLKPTRVLTNMPCLAERLCKGCRRDHRHVHFMSSKAKNAGYYTDERCQSILDAIHLHIEGEHEQSLPLSCQSQNPELLKAGPDMCEPDDVVPFT